MSRSGFLCCFFLAVACSCLAGVAHADDANKKPPRIDFVKQVEPILRRRCYSCHGADKQEGGLRLDLRRNALEGGDSGRAIRPGKSKQSRLVALISEAEPGERMPPKGAALKANEVQVIARWIDQGATWPKDRGVDPRVANHWSFQPIASPAIPAVKRIDWPRGGIDRFILRRLEQKKTRPSPEATRQVLIRRAHLDLLGLPPSPGQWRRWMADPNADWYERMVDALFASPHFGERWGRVWLDLARYADTDGYEKDSPRPHAYHWRDWVLDAVNRDLPFNQFTEQQLAGDLLPGATEETRLATGFHRNTLTNREGGIDKEEDRVKQAVDRLNTVGSVWLGLTVKCAQCHSHKYDPISQREYYRLYAFFNNSDEADFALRPTAEQSARHEREMSAHTKRLNELRAKHRAARKQIEAELPNIAKEFLAKYPNGSAEPSKDGLKVQLTFEAGIQPGIGLQDAKWIGSPTPTFADGKVGKALQLDGSGNRLELGRPIAFASDRPFTIGAWIHFAGGIGSIVTKLDEAADFRGVDFTSNEGMLEVHLVEKWPTDAIKVTTKGRVKKNEWHHVMMTYDGSRKAAGVSVFIDGGRQQLKTHYDRLKGSIDIDQPLRVGSRRAGAYFKGRIDDVHVYDRMLNDDERGVLSGDPRLNRFLELAGVAAGERKPEQLKSMIDFVVDRREPLRKQRDTIAGLEKSPPRLQHGTGMSLAQAKASRGTFVHVRGDFLKKGDEVDVGVPGFLPSMKPRGASPDRLDLARWVLDSRNPLTPRVAVNRVWQHYFGRGLVSTSDDFGTQGEPPSHPELLDWLAGQFVRHNWEMKWLHRQIVTSAAYRQSSAARPDLAESDPYNTWLARQNRIRVDAEMVRDAALATSGLLDDSTHGPSVFPPLPPGILELAFVDVINRGPWKVSPGGDRYRRGFYTFFQRTSPYPMLSLFDAPDSNTTCTRRERSNTPLQALMLWNDPVFVECARSLARRLLQQPARSDAQRIEAAFVAALSRQPDEADRRDVQTLLDASRDAFHRNPTLADKLIGDASAAGVSKQEWTSWISVVRALMNLDEFITRE